MSFRHDSGGTSAAQWREHERWSHLPTVSLAGLDTVVVLAAHPDDESLGAGGLVATAHDLGVAVHVVVATLGEHSHPRSPTHPPAALAVVRRGEALAAVEVLSPGREPSLLGLPDGDLAAHEGVLVDHLVGLVGDGRRTLVVAPWRHDGHPDHEAAGRAAATAASRTGARLLEHPVWWWHWSSPADADWSALRTLVLSPAAVSRKAAAIAAHESQVAALSDQPGDEVLLGPDLLGHFGGPVEVFVVAPPADVALDELHAAAEDPWGVDSRWYEERKRALVLAALPRRRFVRALEVGCSTGGLSAALAPRCGALVAIDASPHAAAGARVRLTAHPHVEVRTGTVPEAWPEGGFDLVVVSEVGYFLSPVALDEVLERIQGCLADDGVVVLCHWRHPVRGWVLDGPEVHQRVRSAGLRPVVATWADRDVELLVLGADEVRPDPSR